MFYFLGYPVFKKMAICKFFSSKSGKFGSVLLIKIPLQRSKSENFRANLLEICTDVLQSVDQNKLGQAFTCRVMPQAQVNTRRQDIEKLGQAFTCWVMPQAQVSTRRQDITSLVPFLVMHQAKGSTRRQDTTSLVPLLAMPQAKCSTRRQDITKLGATSSNAIG